MRGEERTVLYNVRHVGTKYFCPRIHISALSEYFHFNFQEPCKLSPL